MPVTHQRLMAGTRAILLAIDFQDWPSIKCDSSITRRWIVQPYESVHTWSPDWCERWAKWRKESRDSPGSRLCPMVDYLR